MVLIVIPIEGVKGWTHPKVDDLQAKVDFFPGCGGKSFVKVYHRFIDHPTDSPNTQDIALLTLINKDTR